MKVKIAKFQHTFLMYFSEINCPPPPEGKKITIKVVFTVPEHQFLLREKAKECICPSFNGWM